MRKHLNYANVAATLALVIAVAGGTSRRRRQSVIAPKNSVVTKSIRANNVTAGDLTRHHSSELAIDVQRSCAAGWHVHGGQPSVPCPAGTRVLTGGGGCRTADRVSVTASAPVGEGWVVSAKGDGTNTATITATACAFLKRVQKPS